MVAKKKTTKETPFKGMEEMYTSPRVKDADIVKSIIRSHGIMYRSREEDRGFGNGGYRYCIYTPKKQSKHIVNLLEEELSERGM